MNRLFLSLLSFSAFATPAFAMEHYLDAPLEIVGDPDYGEKRLRPRLPDTRAADSLYNEGSWITSHQTITSYPKASMVHSVDSGPAIVPFYAALPHAYGCHAIETYCAEHFPGYEKHYSFVVQESNCFVVQGSKSDGMGASFWPHYGVHFNAPRVYEGTDYKNAAQWTVLPGVKGHIEPRGARFNKVGLISDEVITCKDLVPFRQARTYTYDDPFHPGTPVVMQISPPEYRMVAAPLKTY